MPELLLTFLNIAGVLALIGGVGSLLVRPSYVSGVFLACGLAITTTVLGGVIALIVTGILWAVSKLRTAKRKPERTPQTDMPP
jgi:hypothetical protein